MKKFRWLAILMGITILGITGFQGYWLNDNYEREKQNLELKTNGIFRQTIEHLQASKLNLEKLDLQFDSFPRTMKANVVVRPRKKPGMPDTIRFRKPQSITMMNLLQEKIWQSNGDSGKTRAYIISGKEGFMQQISSDSLAGRHRGITRERGTSNEKNTGSIITITYGDKNNKKGKTDSVNNPEDFFIEKRGPFIQPDEEMLTRGLPHDMQKKNAVFRFLNNIDSVSLKDSVTVKEVTAAYNNRLREERMKGLSFAVSRLDSTYANSPNPNDVTIGFAKPVIFHLSLENKITYLLKQLTLPILFSLLLVGITVVSFVLLYRNVLKQRRLAELKNEFISNITHELKTPIATVGVAIEALKNFNAIHDPERTKEYLDISQNELQRLSLLVDKVLKLSMFEKKEMELKKEQFDCKQLTEEVMNSMKLQFEKYHAMAKLNTEGENFMVEADKLHITSVIYNLLDNALKYSKDNPVIDVNLRSHPDFIEFSVSDNGIGIASNYKEKVFDKFFRVPTGDKHNIKGYGLGLSYVSEVMKRHHGNVFVESELGKGSTFTAKFPYV